MPRLYYNTEREAETDAERYDEFYAHSQLRTPVKLNGADEWYVVYNAPWPREDWFKVPNPLNHFREER